MKLIDLLCSRTVCRRWHFLSTALTVLLFAPFINAVDIDADGLDDAAETSIHLTDPTRRDTDGDGQSDGAEIRAGTDPRSVASVFRIVAAPQRVTTGWEVTWSTVPGKTYRLQRAEGDVMPPLNVKWIDVGGKVASGFSASQVDATTSGVSRRFYRVILVEDTADDTEPPVISPIMISNVQTEAGGRVRLSVSATDNIAVADVGFFNGQATLGAGLHDGADVWRFDWAPAAASTDAQSLSATARDTAGNAAASPSLAIKLLDKNFYSPLGTDGTSIDGFAVQDAVTGKVLPFEYRPGGASAVGQRGGFSFRFPKGAKIVAGQNGPEIEFTDAEAGFGENSPVQLGSPLKLSGTAVKRIAIGSMSLDQALGIFGAAPMAGLPVTFGGKALLILKSASFVDGTMSDARFGLSAQGLPLQGAGVNVPDFNVDFTSKQGIKIPLSGEFTLPDGTDMAPKLVVGPDKPIWLHIRLDGSMKLVGGAELRLGNGGKFRVNLNVDDPNYQMQIIADGLQFRLLGNLADLLPGSAEACIPASVTPSQEDLLFAVECLRRFDRAYLNFSTALMGQSALATDGDGRISAAPAAALEAWGYRALASTIVPQADNIRALNDLFRQTGESALTARDLSGVLAHRLALHRAKKALSLEDQTALTEAITLAAEAALDRAKNPESVSSIETLREAIGLLLETEILIQSAGQTALETTSSELAIAIEELLNTYLARQLAELGVTGGANNTVISAMNRFTIYQLLQSLIGLKADAQKLGLEFRADLPLDLALSQLALRLEQVLAQDLHAARVAADFNAFTYAMEDHLDLHAWHAQGVFSSAELSARLDALPMALLAAQMGQVAAADPTFGAPRLTVQSQVAEVTRLAQILRKVPQNVTFASDSLVRAFNRMESSLTSALNTISMFDSASLETVLEAGTLHEEIRQRFGFTTVKWEDARLAQVVDRLRAKSIEQKAWEMAHRGAAFLVDKAARLIGKDARESRFYLQQALKLIGGQQQIASALWQQEAAARPAIGIVDMALPGDIYVNRAAGQLNYNRKTHELNGAFKGELRLPKFDLALEIQNASFSTGGAMDIAVRGGVNLPLLSPAVKFEIPVRHPLVIRYRAPRNLSVSAGGKLTLPDGSSFLSYFTVDDPLYRFGIEARGLKFNLATNMLVHLPAFPNAANFTPEVMEALQEYYRGLSASVEGMAGLQELPAMGEPGAPPDFQDQTLSLPPDLINAFAAGLLAEVDGVVARDYTSSIGALRENLRQLANELREQRDAVHSSEVLVRARALQRLCRAVQAKRGQTGSQWPALWDSAEFRDFFLETQLSLRHMLTREDSTLLDNVDSTLAAAYEVEVAAQCLGEDLANVPYISAYYQRVWNVALTNLFMNPATGEITDAVQFGKMSSEKLHGGLRQLVGFHNIAMRLGFSPASAHDMAVQRLAMGYREKQLTNLVSFAHDNPGDYYEIGRLTTELLEFSSDALTGSFEYPNSPILQADGSMATVTPNEDLQRNFVAKLFAAQTHLANRIEREGNAAVLGLRRDHGKDYFGLQLKRVVEISKVANRPIPNGLAQRLNEFFRADLARATEAIQSRWTANRLHEAKEALDNLVNLAVYAQAMNLPEASQIGTFITDVLTTKMTVGAEAQKSAWLLSRYTALLLEAAKTKVGNDAIVIRGSLHAAAMSSLRASDRLVRNLKNLLPASQPYDIAMPGAVHIKKAFGEVTYRRDSGVLGGKFGGRLEFPNHKAYFEVSEGTIDTTGAFTFKAKTAGPLSLGSVRLTATLDAFGGPQRPFGITGTGDVQLPGGEKFSARASFDSGARALEFTTGSANIRFAENAFLFGAEAGYKLGGLTQNGVIAENGEVTMKGTVGLLRTAAPPAFPNTPSAQDFHVIIENAAVKFAFAPGEFSLSIPSGDIVLPPAFSATLCDQFPTNAVRPRARIGINAATPIEARFKLLPPTQDGPPMIESLRLKGALVLQNLGVTAPNFADLSAAICDGSFLFPEVEIKGTNANITALPKIRIASGKFKFPLPPSAPAVVDLIDFEYGFDGLPTGTLALADDVTFFDSGGFSFSLLGGQSCGPGDVATGLRVLRPTLPGAAPTVEIHGGVRLKIAKNIVSRKSGTGTQAEPGQDPDQVTGRACGNIVLRPNAKPELNWEMASIEGSFKLGQNGVAIQGGRLDLMNLGSLFSSAVNPPLPFTVNLSGKIVLPNGPGFGMQNSKFVFNNLNPNVPGLPEFQPGTYIYDGSQWSLGKVLPFNVKNAKLVFKQGGLGYPEIFNPLNITIVVSASLALPSGEAPVLKGEVNDFTVNFKEDGTPIFSMNSVEIVLNSGQSIPPLEDLGGSLYIGGLDDPANLFFTGKIGGSYSGYKVKLLVAFNLVGPVGACLDVNAGTVGIPLDVTGFLMTGASGGVSFLNRINDPCEFTSYIDPVTGRPVSSPSPVLPAFPKSLLSWEEFRRALVRAEQTAVAFAPMRAAREPAEEASTFEEPPLGNLTARSAPSGAVQALGGFGAARGPAEFEIPCPGDCPPATINIFCQPHPDPAVHPGRIITKFTSIDEATLNKVFGITFERIQQLKNSNVNIAASVAQTIRVKLEEIIPKPDAAFLGAERAALIMQLHVETLRLIEAGFTNAIGAAIANTSGAQAVYDAIKTVVYGGLPCPDLTLQVSGTFSHAVVSSFLSATAEATISTTGAAGVTGKINLLGMPVGRGKLFVAATDDHGLPNPSACGQILVALGPLELGELKGALQCDGCVTGILSVFGEFVRAFATDTGRQTLNLLINKVAPRLRGVSPEQFIANTSDQEKLAFIAELMMLPAESLPVNLPERVVQALGAAWDLFNPEFLLCGAVKPKLFGLPMGNDSVAVQARVFKRGVQAQFSFSPIGLIFSSLGVSVAGSSGVLAGLLTSVDKASYGYQELVTNPVDVMLAGLRGKLNSPQAVASFAEERFASMLENTTGVMEYELSPMGMRLVGGAGRMILPDLTDHPKFRTGGWVRPENRGLISRESMLEAALRVQYLGNALWAGSAKDIHTIFPPQSTERARFENSGITLTRDYFPHGGVVGAGFIDVPRVLYDAIPNEFALMLNANANPLERLGAAATWVFDYVLATTNAGTLGFYVPAPNPPTLTRDGRALTPRELLDSIMARDVTKLEPGEAWSLSEAFLRGELDGRFLGIPIANGKIIGVPPGNGSDAYFQITAEMPRDSWMSNFVERASLLFDLRQSPTNTIEARFTEIGAAINRARADGISDAQRLAALQAAINAATDGLPKAKLEARLENFRLPAILQPFISTPSGANNYSLHAFSPRFEPGFSGTGPLAERRRDGGIALTGTFLFGSYFRVDNAQLGVAPKLPDPITHITPPPALSGSFSNISANLGPNLTFSNVQLEFNSEPRPGQAVIDARGSFPEILLPPFLQIDAVDRGNLGARLLLRRGMNNLPESEIKVDAAYVYSQFLDPAKRITIDGGANGQPFTFSTDTNVAWSGRVVFQDHVAVSAGGRQFMRYEGPSITGELKGKGLTDGAIRVALKNDATLVAFPGAPQELRFKLNPASADAAFTIRADGTFTIKSALAADLQMPFGPVALFKTGATVTFTEQSLVIGGTVIGGALEGMEASATGSLTLTRNDNAITVSFSGDVSLPPLQFGIFQIVNANAPRLAAQFSSEGISIPGAQLLISNIGQAGSSAQALAMDTFTLKRDGSFSAGIRPSPLNLGGFALTNVAARLDRTAATAGNVTTMVITGGGLNDTKLPGARFGGSISSSGSVSLKALMSAGALLNFPVRNLELSLTNQIGFSPIMGMGADLNVPAFQSLRLAGTATNSGAISSFALDFNGTLGFGGYTLADGKARLFSDSTGQGGLTVSGSIGLGTLGTFAFAGNLQSDGAFTLRSGSASRAVNGFDVRFVNTLQRSFGNQYASGVLASGPFGYWRFNEGSGTVARSEVGSWNSAYIGGPDLRSASILSSDRCVTLNGAGQYVALGNDATMNFTGAFTVECWVKIPAFTQDWQAIVTKGDSAWRLHRFAGSRTVAFGTSGLSNVDLPGTTVIDDNQWHHLAVVYDGFTKRLYVDGKLDAYARVTGRLAENAHRVLVGENDQQTGRFLAGSVDELAVYRKALSPTEISEHVAQSGAALLRSQATINLPGFAPLNLDGSINGDGSFAFEANPGVIRIGDFQLGSAVARFARQGSTAAELFVTGEITLPGVDKSFFYGNLSASGQVDLTAEPGSLHLRGFSFNNVALRLEGTDGGAIKLGARGLLTTPWAALDFSGNISSAGTLNLTNVISSETTLFNYPVRNITNVIRHLDYFTLVRADQPFAYYRLNQSSGTTATDSGTSFVRKHGTYVGVTLNSPGALTITPDAAPLFNGKGHVALPSPELFNFTHALTVEAWVKVNAFTRGWQAIVAKGDNSWRLSRYGDTSKISFDTTSSGQSHSLISQRDFMADQWYHVAAVFDGKTKYLYINGILENSAAYERVIDSSTHPVFIGENSQATGRQWNGQIDEVALYSGPLSSSQIAAHYQAGGGPVILMSLNSALPQLGSVAMAGAFTPEAAFSLQSRTASQQVLGVSLNQAVMDLARPAGGNASLQLLGTISVPNLQNLTVSTLRGSVSSTGVVDMSLTAQNATVLGFGFRNLNLDLDGTLSSALASTRLSAAADLALGNNFPAARLSGTISGTGTVDLSRTLNMSLGGFAATSVKLELSKTKFALNGLVDLIAAGHTFKADASFSGELFTDGNYTLTTFGNLRIGSFDTLNATFTLTKDGVSGLPTLTFGDANGSTSATCQRFGLTSSGVSFYAERAAQTGWFYFPLLNAHGFLDWKLILEQSSASGQYNARVTGCAYAWQGPPPNTLGEVQESQRRCNSTGWTVGSNGEVTIEFGLPWAPRFRFDLWPTPRPLP